MQHARQLELIADLWGGRITHILEISVSYSSLLNLCPSVLGLCSSTSQQTGLDFTFCSSHCGLIGSAESLRQHVGSASSQSQCAQVWLSVCWQCRGSTHR